jgi:hypothetical protein
MGRRWERWGDRAEAGVGGMGSSGHGAQALGRHAHCGRERPVEPSPRLAKLYLEARGVAAMMVCGWPTQAALRPVFVLPWPPFLIPCIPVLSTQRSAIPLPLTIHIYIIIAHFMTYDSDFLSTDVSHFYL